ncbi:MAG: hypothetical protein JXA46_16260 [Dehalococcoidales bacterium]|nr:hypothetical protein [Dehalococcoidales bacterium]
MSEGISKNRSGVIKGIDPTLGLADKIIDHVEKVRAAEKTAMQKGDYYALCPSCGRKVVRNSLLENGCFLCGWKGTAGEMESDRKELRNKAFEPGSTDYKRRCPACGSMVVTEEFLRKGCWVCGYRK